MGVYNDCYVVVVDDDVVDFGDFVDFEDFVDAVDGRGNVVVQLKGLMALLDDDDFANDDYEDGDGMNYD